MRDGFLHDLHPLVAAAIRETQVKTSFTIPKTVFVTVHTPDGEQRISVKAYRDSIFKKVSERL